MIWLADLLLLSNSGLMFSRNNIQNPKIKDFDKAICYQQLENKLIIEALDAFEANKTYKFDALVGDNKCQTRVSMLLDLYRKKSDILAILFHDKSLVKANIHKLSLMRKQIDFDKYSNIQAILKDIKGLSLEQIFQFYNLNESISVESKFITLLYIAALLKDQMAAYVDSDISFHQVQKLNIRSKIELCKLSINYEKYVGLQHEDQGYCQLLNQVEINAFCSMTSFFPSYKFIFKKMKKEKSDFIIERYSFCDCGGSFPAIYEYYSLIDNKYLRVDFPNLIDTSIKIIQGYIFNGSLLDLKRRLNIPDSLSYIPQQYIRSCSCNAHLVKNEIDDIEESILANFAQHPQFTTAAEIDWNGLGLLNSDLKKEFDYLNTLPGYSIHDMSKFCINHIYASTLQQVTQKKAEFEEKLRQNEAALSTKSSQTVVQI